jgi:hypothetical protein
MAKLAPAIPDIAWALMGTLVRGASTTWLVSGMTTTELVALNRSSWMISTGRGLEA